MKSEQSKGEETTSADPEARRFQDVTEDQPGGSEGDAAPDNVLEDAEAAEIGLGATAGELQEMKDRYLRLAAEYDNFRRRTERERTESRDRAQGQIVEKLLEPLDDLQRVAQFSADGATVDSLLEGVRMVDKKLMRALESAGLEPVVARGERFDPSEHDALMVTTTAEESEDETVGEVFQSGYRFRGILLRPAKVQVRKFEG